VTVVKPGQEIVAPALPGYGIITADPGKSPSPLHTYLRQGLGYGIHDTADKQYSPGFNIFNEEEERPV